MSQFSPTPKNRLLAILALLATAIVWGSSFFIIQAAMTHDVWLMLAIRMFVGAGAVLLLARGRCLGFPRPRRALWIWTGVLIGTAYAAQNFGVRGTSVSNAAVISSLCIVFTPLLSSALGKERTTAGQWVAAAIGVGAFAVLGAEQGFDRLSMYDAITLITAVAVAFHIFCFGAAVREPGMLMNVVFYQFIVAGCGMLACHFVFEAAWVHFTSGELLALIYLGAVCCGVAYVLQAFGQRYLSPLQVVLIISTEPLWAIAITRIVRGDPITVGALIASGMLLVANVVAERRQKERGESRVKAIH